MPHIVVKLREKLLLLGAASLLFGITMTLSYGTYEIDERAHTFTYHVDGALVRTLIGKDLTRIYEFSGKQLIVKSSSPNEHWRVVWEHF